MRKIITSSLNWKLSDFMQKNFPNQRKQIPFPLKGRVRVGLLNSYFIPINRMEIVSKKNPCGKISHTDFSSLAIQRIYMKN